MANHASAVKRIRSNETKRLRNRYQLKSCRTAIKKLRKNKVAEEAVIALNKINAMLDKLAKRKVLHKNKSASTKSKLAQYVNSLQKKTSSTVMKSKKKSAEKAS
ncbi:MAG: 30S ribosomal protein S20 [Bacteroidota bacterium]